MFTLIEHLEAPPTMTVVWGVVLPLVAAVVAWSVWGVFRRSPNRLLVGRGGGGGGIAGGLAALGVGGAFGLAFYAADRSSGFPPRSSHEWLIYSAAVVVVLAMVEGIWRPETIWRKLAIWVPATLVMLIPLTSAWRVSVDIYAPENGPRFTPAQAWRAVAGWTVGVLALRAAVGQLGCRTPVATTFSLGVVSAVVAAVLGMSGSQFAMPFRAASVGLALLPLLILQLWAWKKGAEMELPPAALTVWTILTAGSVLASYLYYELTRVNALLLLVGIGVAALVPGRRPLVRMGLILFPVVVALVAAAISTARAFSDSGGY